MAAVLLLAFWTTLLPQAPAPQRIAPMVPAQHFRPVIVPFEYFDKHIFIKLTLNGIPGMVFLLDSGTSSNVLNLRTSEELGLKPVSIQQAKGLGLGFGKIHVAAVKDIDARIGGVQVANLMAVVDLQGLEDHFAHRQDGILGFPFLQHFVVVVDFDRHELMLLPSKRYRYRGAGRTIFLRRKSKSASIPVTLGTGGLFSRQAILDVDTGSDVTLLLYPHYVHGAHMGKVFSAMPTVKAYGLDGYFQMQIGLLPSLAMGSMEARNVGVFQMRGEPGGADAGCAGVIGTSILEQFQKVVFDLPGRRIIFEMRPGTRVAGEPPTAWMVDPLR